ncbi:hypothetical protein IQ255_00555 [Pleurocapsales cyanobacterium LEGE 10410]|nr:hypothetical protein [Pleurocapsales cyanobacterium LEGE 10410]
MRGNQLVIPNVPNVSLIALYGEKPPQLTSLIDKLQACLADYELIRGKFVAYQLEQVHGTIIGCEGVKTEAGIINQWFYELRQEIKYLNPDLVDYLQHQANFPLTIRFGGYDRATDYNFLSRSQPLYDRSFQLQPSGDLTIPILIGWSWEDNNVSLAIDNLRRNLQQYNLLHKYHGNPDAVDNDFYLCLGTFDTLLTNDELTRIATDIRNLLETRSLNITLNLSDLAFAQYQDLSLTPATTKIIPVTEITASQLERLYFDW